jgi:copper chaperone
MKLKEVAIMKTIKIKGMSCNHCVMAVTKTLEKIDGVKNLKVDLARAEATFDEAKPVDIEIVKERIRKAGYDVA